MLFEIVYVGIVIEVGRFVVWLEMIGIAYSCISILDVRVVQLVVHDVDIALLYLQYTLVIDYKSKVLELLRTRQLLGFSLVLHVSFIYLSGF